MRGVKVRASVKAGLEVRGGGWVGARVGGWGWLEAAARYRELGVQPLDVLADEQDGHLRIIRGRVLHEMGGEKRSAAPPRGRWRAARGVCAVMAAAAAAAAAATAAAVLLCGVWVWVEMSMWSGWGGLVGAAGGRAG